MNTPLVSIITPVKNDAKYIAKCLDSVVGQSYPFIEHFIVDGVSTDGTLEIIKEYSEAYPTRVAYISEPDKGANDAWVKGMKLSHGSILGFLGSDDTLKLGAIRAVVDFFNTTPEAKFMFGGCNRIDAKGKVISRIVTKEFDLQDAINNYCSIPATSAYFKREVVEKVDPSIMIENNSELEFWLQVAKKFKIWRIESVLSNFRIYADKERKDGFYINASTQWAASRKHGARLLSPVAKRYYLALLTKPLSPIIDPIFRYITSGK